MMPPSLKLERRTLGTLVLYVVGINCLLYVLYLKPLSSSTNTHEEWHDFVQDYISRFQRPPPKGMATWLQHAQRHQCETRNFYDALNKDIDYFRQQAPLDMDQVIPINTQMTDTYMALSLDNHKLTLVEHLSLPGQEWQRKPIFRLLKKLLRPTIQHSPPLNTTFVFNLHDTARDTTVNAKVPLFSVCKMDYYTNNQPPPSSNTTTTHHNNNHHTTATTGPDFVASKDLLVPWWFSLRFQSTKLWFWPLLNSGLPFQYRQDAITWRGSTTSAWETGPRFQLVRKFGGTHVHKLQYDNHTQIDVEADFAFIRVVKSADDPPLRRGYYRFAKHMFYWQMQLRKYILDVDGNGFTSRFPGLLRSGSLVFKSTRYREWFHGIVKPYEDYIPVNYNLSDLVEKVDWAHSNPQLAKRIVQKSREQAERHMRVEDMQCYMYRLMLEYQALFEEQ